MKKWIYFSCILVWVACAAPKLLPISSNDTLKAQSKYPDITTSMLQEGQEHFKKNCQKCHSLKLPWTRTEAQWTKILPRMAKRAKLTAEQEASVQKYLFAFSKM